MEEDEGRDGMDGKSDDDNDVNKASRLQGKKVVTYLLISTVGR